MAMASEVFALTDEQIVGLGPEKRGQPSETNDRESDESRRNEAESAREVREIPRSADSARNDAIAVVPQWLAERMRDPWCGDQATEFWEATQNAQKEARAYREIFATPEDARTLKELYPGGVIEARAVAERARVLDEIDAAFYRGDAASRTQLAQRMMAQDPAAFREMVEAGMRLLRPESAQAPAQTGNHREPGMASVEDAREAQPGVAVPQEVVRAYGEFEKAANAELEGSVGGAIARAMESALPNLRLTRAPHNSGEARVQEVEGTAPLQQRLASAVREEVEAGLKSDRQLGEQVVRLLAGKRFNHEARTQVVRLIDARAQQLVPGAVKRVVSSWTQTTLAAKGKEPAPRVENNRREAAPQSRPETARASAAHGSSRGRRVDYKRMSDEEILSL
jgi:hypothetical protein